MSAPTVITRLRNGGQPDLREALQRIADGDVMRDKPVYSHAETVLAYQSLARAALAKIQEQPRFKSVACSQCGCAFGPGNEGFSHCEDHAGMRGVR